MAGKVLIVDDNEINALLLQNILNFYNVESDCALGGGEAILMVGKEKYSVIFMDYIMPEMNGVETTSHIREIDGYSDIPVVALSGDNGDEIRNDFAKVGVDILLTKPVEPVAVIEVLTKYGVTSDSPETESEKNNDGTGNCDEENLKDYLKDVEGIDYEKGFSNSMGNEKNYFLVIKAGIKNIEDCDAKLEGFVNSSNNSVSMEDLKIALHSLKSIFLNIGIREESKEAAIHEQYVKDMYDEATGTYKELPYDEIAKIRDYHETVKGLNATLIKAAESYDNMLRKKQSIESKGQMDVSDEDFLAMSSETLKAVNLFDIDAIVEGIEKMIPAVKSEEAKSLLNDALDATETFNYDLILKNIEAINRGEAR